jgi:molybdenum cofactor cytidylyltransferase
VKNGTIAAVVLAAGRSSRMGRHKLLLPLGGRPLVSYAIEAACASSADPVCVVLGYQAPEVEAALPSGRYRVRVNPNFVTGMASSLRLGIETLMMLPAEVEPHLGAIIVLADQPLVSSSLINRLLMSARATPEAIIAAAYAGQRSTPVYFPYALFPELLQIEGDEGGRSVIAHHPDLVKLESVEERARGLDIDREEEYEQLLAQWDHYSTNPG